MFKFVENLQVLPLQVPAAFTSDATVTNSAYVKINRAHWVSFVIPVGLFGTTAATDTVKFQLQCSTAGSSNATEIEVPFRYRLSNILNTGGWGAITTATASNGVSLTGVAATGGGNRVLVLELDPATLPALQPDGLFVRVVQTFSTNAAGVIGGIQAVIEPRFPGNAIPTAT